MPGDLGLNNNFSVFEDDRNDIYTVEGREQFEQSVVIKLTDFMYENTLGEPLSGSLIEKIKLQISRVARTTDVIESIESVEIKEGPDVEGKLRVNVSYAADGAEFSADI